MTVDAYESSDAPQSTQTYTAGWFLKRLLIALTILILSFGGLAWLTHAAIDPSLVEGETLIEAIGRLATQF